jgi:hypothetical protein
VVFEYEKRKKVEQSSPKNCLERREHFGRNDGSDGIGCIVKTIDVVKYKCQYDDNYEKNTHKNGMINFV